MKSSVIFVFLIVVNLQALTQPLWKVVKEKNGITVSLANVESSKFKSIRVQGIFDGTITKLISIIYNMNSASGWVYKTKTASVLKRLTPYEFVYYTETSMPWPVSNRDAIIHLTINPDTAHHLLRINAFSEPNYIEKKNGLVRVPYSKASWYVTESNNKLNIDYTFEVNPGGSLPAWLVNLMADKGPYETFRNLMTKLKQ